MKTKVEGILLNKIPHQERHLIGKLLLRSGKVISVMFYGGQGGGKKSKPSVAEVGHMLKLELSQSKPTVEIYKVKETSTLWSHKLIRSNHIAFYIMCFAVEYISRISLEENLHDEHVDSDKSNEGLFRVLSNLVFYLDKCLENKNFSSNFVMALFLSKLAIETGVYPNLSQCVLSGEDLTNIMQVTLMNDHGGFADMSCLNSEDRSHYQRVDRGLWMLMREVSNVKFQDIESRDVPNEYVNSLVDYISYQHGVHKSDFKSLKMLL